MADDAADRSDKADAVSVEETRQLIGTSDARVLDLRSDDEWTLVGNIAGALRCSADEAPEAAKQIDDDKRIIVVCSAGDRSAEVAEKLRDDGRDAVSLDGGMKSWEDEGLPMQPSDDPDPPAEGPPPDDEDAAGEADAGDQDEAADEARPLS